MKAIQSNGTPQAVESGNPLIVIMAGQSNMAGGYNEDHIEPDTARIKYVGPAGAGPIKPFAEAFIAKHPQASLIVVACPLSGTYISQWMPGGLIENCIASAKAQEANGIMSGFIFLQGEADAKEIGYTYDWAQSFTTIARYVRSSLGVNVAVVLGRINRTTMPNFPMWDHIRLEQDSVSLDNMSRFYTDGAQLLDGIHYDQAGYAMVGQRIADSFYSLLGGK